MELLALHQPIVFFEEELAVDNPNKRTMNEFSAIGLTNESVFKPDITAPGGSIESLGNDQSYIRMSGTSMASPYIAGVMALGLERAEQMYPTLSKKEQLQLVKRMLYSSARPLSRDGVLVSPRKQGSGIVDIDGVMNAKVIAYASEEQAKVHLGDVSDTLTIPMTLQNLSDETVTLKGSYVLLKDEVVEGVFTLRSETIREEAVEDVVLKPHQVKKIEHVIDISDIDYSSEQVNGYFIDGFVQYEYGPKDPLVSMAFTSFKGEYEALPVLEKPIYEFKDQEPIYYNNESYENYFTHLGSDIVIDEDTSKHVVLGERGDSVIGDRKFDGSHIAISPNGDGKLDNLKCVITTLRTFQRIQIDIRDAEGHLVESYGKQKTPDFLKHYYGADYSQNLAVTVYDFKNEALKDFDEGKYKVEILVFRDASAKTANQMITYDIAIDRTLPVIDSITVEDGRMKVVAHDNESNVMQVKASLNGKKLEMNEDGFDVSDVEDLGSIYIEVLDDARNTFDTFYSSYVAHHSLDA